MKKVYIIAQNTFRELLRNRLLYGFLFFSIFLLFLMMALGQLSYTEQYRLTISLGLGAIHMCLMGLTVFVGGSLVYREIDKLTILTVLARPLSRSEFLFGKYFGFLNLMFVFLFGFYLIYILNLILMGFDFLPYDIFIVFVGMGLEIMLLLSVTLFFSTFCATFLTMIFSLCFFIIGHWSEGLSQLVINSENKEYLFLVRIIHFAFPNLERFNWRLYPLEHHLSSASLFSSLGLAIFWSLFFLFSAAAIFRTRDFA